ncbi:MAG: RnfABCDGE type electron transport complex subunit D [Clostridia bacterium]|nr:RnfABCDGE type electron transport complex subunit D [Clostridia bacterium]
MNKLTVSSAPHIRSSSATNRVMLDVIIALLPTAIAGSVIFGWQAIATILICVLSSVLAEFIYNLILKKEQTVGDFSAAVTGLLLGLNMPANFTEIWWQCIIGSAFAIIVVKCLFGGLGANFANPAITGRIFMMICYTGTVGKSVFPIIGSAELSTGATPLVVLGSDNISSLPSLFDMLLGLRGGAIGEVCILALLVGFVYLVVRKVIYFETPLIMIGTVFVLSLLVSNDPVYALYQVMSGGLILGAVFMATDYVTTPINRTGKMIFALGAGLITVLIRLYGSYPEGVSFAILLMNILSPYIEKWTAKRPLGAKRVKGGTK